MNSNKGLHIDTRLLEDLVTRKESFPCNLLRKSLEAGNSVEIPELGIRIDPKMETATQMEKELEEEKVQLAKQIHDVEKQAMIGNMQASLLLVSAFREVRQAIEYMLRGKYQDGSVDQCTLCHLTNTIEQAYADLVGRAEDLGLIDH